MRTSLECSYLYELLLSLRDLSCKSYRIRQSFAPLGTTFRLCLVLCLHGFPRQHGYSKCINFNFHNTLLIRVSKICVEKQKTTFHAVSQTRLSLIIMLIFDLFVTMRSHIGWRGKQNISYKRVGTSP